MLIQGKEKRKSLQKYLLEKNMLFIFKKFESQVKLNREEYIKHEIEVEIKILIEKKTELK